MGLRRKIYIAFSVFMMLILIMIVTSFNLVSNLNEELGKSAERKFDNASRIAMVRNETAEISRLLNDPLLRQGEELTVEEQFSNHRNGATSALEEMKLLSRDGRSLPLLVSIQVQLTDYIRNAESVMEAIRAGDKERELGALKLEHSSRDRLFERIDRYTVLMQSELTQSTDQTQDKLRRIRIIMLLLMMVILLGAALLAVNRVRKVFDSIAGVVTVMNNMALGSADSIERMQVKSEDELGAVALAYNRLADTLERHIRYERAYQKEIEEQNWLKTTIADITTMYQGVQDVGTLADRLLSKLVPLIGASYGAFYVVDDESDRPILRRLAAYAGNESAEMKERFEFGEGLVGQCATERQTIYLENLSDYDYNVRSATLDTAPSEVVIVPVEHEDKILAVIEFATLTAFTPLHQLLLQQVMNNAGITIRSVLDNMRVQLLLSDSQALTLELQAQSEEMQQQQEELISINEKLEEQYRSSELRSLELQSIKAELEEKARLLEQSSRYKTEFLANMSHELRTPLNSLLILTKILQDNEEGRLSEKQVEYAGAIYSSGQQLLQLINDILDLSKAESGKVQVRKEQVSISGLLSFAEKMFFPVAREKELEFFIEKDPDIPDVLFSDPQRLQQILNNLLANAFKFTDRGAVTLRVSGYGETLVTGAYDWIAISVTDTGIGIPGDKQSLIFEAFQQADGTTSRKYGGTGLGLSISRNIAELLGGSIQVQSREGYGSTFTLYLPLDDESAYRPPVMFAAAEAAAASESEAAEAASEEEAKPLHGHTILIVDDDIRNVFALTAVLEAQKVNVLFAENGRDGIEKLRAHPEIDLVLMDIMMPEMDGLEAIRAIRVMPEYENLPVIALTAKAMKSDREQCIEAGASDYISKPLQQEQLISLIRVWLYR